MLKEQTRAIEARDAERIRQAELGKLDYRRKCRLMRKRGYLGARNLELVARRVEGKQIKLRTQDDKRKHRASGSVCDLLRALSKLFLVNEQGRFGKHESRFDEQDWCKITRLALAFMAFMSLGSLDRAMRKLKKSGILETNTTRFDPDTKTRELWIRLNPDRVKEVYIEVQGSLYGYDEEKAKADGQEIVEVAVSVPERTKKPGKKKGSVSSKPVAKNSADHLLINDKCTLSPNTIPLVAPCEESLCASEVPVPGREKNRIPSEIQFSSKKDKDLAKGASSVGLPVDRMWVTAEVKDMVTFIGRTLGLEVHSVTRKEYQTVDHLMHFSGSDSQVFRLTEKKIKDLAAMADYASNEAVFRPTSFSQLLLSWMCIAPKLADYISSTKEGLRGPDAILNLHESRHIDVLFQKMVKTFRETGWNDPSWEFISSESLDLRAIAECFSSVESNDVTTVTAAQCERIQRGFAANPMLFVALNAKYPVAKLFGYSETFVTLLTKQAQYAAREVMTRALVACNDNVSGWAPDIDPELNALHTLVANSKKVGCSGAHRI